MYTIPYYKALADFFRNEKPVDEIYAYDKWGNHRRDHQIEKLKNIYIPYARKEVRKPMKSREMCIRRDFEFDPDQKAA